MTVTAGTDMDTVNDTVSLTHSAASTDANYNGITIGGVAVSVHDNDTGNSLATGKPAISGTAQVGETLTAGIGTIADADGLPSHLPRRLHLAVGAGGCGRHVDRDRYRRRGDGSQLYASRGQM